FGPDDAGLFADFSTGSDPQRTNQRRPVIDAAGLIGPDLAFSSRLGNSTNRRVRARPALHQRPHELHHLGIFSAIEHIPVDRDDAALRSLNFPADFPPRVVRIALI